jgi:hypothetical protein
MLDAGETNVADDGADRQYPRSEIAPGDRDFFNLGPIGQTPEISQRHRYSPEPHTTGISQLLYRR